MYRHPPSWPMNLQPSALDPMDAMQEVLHAGLAARGS